MTADVDVFIFEPYGIDDEPAPVGTGRHIAKPDWKHAVDAARTRWEHFVSHGGAITTTQYPRS